MPQHVVIIGAGQAAAQAATSLRQGGYAGRVTLVGAEPELPYQRPPLSKKYLVGELARERMSIRPASFYAQHSIELELGVPAEAIDAASHSVTLADGRRIAGDALLLATGARVRRLDIPGVDLDGVHVMRSLADTDRLIEATASIRRLVIVGGGYIGLEVAASMAKRGLEVTVLEGAPRIMQRVVGADTAAFFAAKHAAAGVNLCCGTSVSGIIGRTQAEGVSTLDGHEYPADLVLLAAGIVPDTALAERAGLPCSDGIEVDAYAATPAPGVYAAGDCTSLPSGLYGRRVRLESVHNAIEQAKTAAASMLGQPRLYDDVPWFWSDQYDVKLQIAGLSQGFDQACLRGDPATNRFAVFYLREGRLIAVDAVNDPRSFLAAKKLIAERACLTPEQLADPAFDPSQAAVHT